VLDTSGISGPYNDESESSILRKQKEHKEGPKFHDDTYLSDIDSQDELEEKKDDDDIVYCEELFQKALAESKKDLEKKTQRQMQKH